MADGAQAESRAADYLIEQGLTLVERNFRCRGGEIDLIMRDGAYLVFIEVRQRTHSRFGGALESIDARKQRKLMTAAQLYLARYTRLPPCRFDVVLIEGKTAALQWLRNAFSG
uniref:Putative endonuclease n=1 Tax=mine drainage metagenome TaxID=410659 RepID=E6QUB7_9ZZZZ